MFEDKADVIDDVRTAIFDAAVELFARRGYFATTVRDIVEKAGVTQPMVYYYFGSKEQLFITCIKELHAVETKKFKSVDPTLPFAEFMSKFMAVCVEAFQERPEGFMMLIHLAHSRDEYPQFPEMGEIISQPLHITKEAIIQAKKRGEVKSNVQEEAFGIALFGALEMAASMIYISHTFKMPFDVTPHNFAKEVMEMLLYGVMKK